MTDRQLIDRYLAGDAESLAELVRRHIDMVHAAARQQTRGDSALADDITQAVFLLLMRRARSLPQNVILAGWLYKTTWYVAAEMRRQNRRRQGREREAVPMQTPPPSALDPAVMRENQAAIHDAITRLPADDRSAIVLHYLEGKSSADVAAALATSDAAIRTRLTRARERLRTLLRRAGITLSVAAVATLLETSKAQAAPAALLAQVQTFAAGAAPAVSVQSLVSGVLHMAIRAKQIAIALSVVAVALGLGAVVMVLQNKSSEPAPPLAATVPASEPAGAAATAQATDKIIAIEFAGTADFGPLRQALTLHVGDTFSQDALRVQVLELTHAGAPLKDLQIVSTFVVNSTARGFIIRYIADAPDAVVAARKAAKDVVLTAYHDALAGNEDLFVTHFGSLSPEGKLLPVSDENKALLRSVARDMHAFDLLLAAVGDKFGPEVEAQLNQQVPLHTDPREVENSTVQLPDDAHAIVDMGTTGPGKVQIIHAGDAWLIDTAVLATMNAAMVQQVEAKVGQINALTAAVKAGQFPDAASFQNAIAGAITR